MSISMHADPVDRDKGSVKHVRGGDGAAVDGAGRWEKEKTRARGRDWSSDWKEWSCSYMGKPLPPTCLLAPHD